MCGWIACGLVVCTHFGPANTRSQKCNRAKYEASAALDSGDAHAESCSICVVAPIAHAPPLEGEVGGDQSGSDVEGGDDLGNEIESISSEGDKMVDAGADLQVEEMGLLIASAVDGARPSGVQTQKKKARSDGDLPLGADTEFP